LSRVRPRVMGADEAKASIQDSIMRIHISTSKLIEYIDQLLDLDAAKEDNETGRGLIVIKEQISELAKYTNDTSSFPIGEQLYQKAQSILKSFMNLNDSLRTVEITLRAETEAVMINAAAREIISTEPKTERPDGFRPRFKGWTVDGMRQELASEFQLRYPRFLGHLIRTSLGGKDFSIRLEHVPESPFEIQYILEVLKDVADQFLERELLDAPLTFMYDVTAFKTAGMDNLPSINCTVARPEDSHFR